MSRLLVTNIKKCGSECPFYSTKWYGVKLETKCIFGSEDGEKITKLEVDGFPKFCKLEKVVKE